MYVQRSRIFDSTKLNLQA